VYCIINDSKVACSICTWDDRQASAKVIMSFSLAWAAVRWNSKAAVVFLPVESTIADRE
jgi:hypothetical protein